ncbi:MAG: carboxypeptidase regulatory-like domain-containing protein [Candidatus Solibacter sp.]|nr:carboxypeptidase regulatory-like domain-containing protein [Candidatus Solibacter sp.]
MLTGAVGVFGQSGSSTLLGTLTDPADAVVPNVTVTVTDQATGAVYNSSSNESGLFRVLNLRPGSYSLRVQAAAGFKAFDMTNIALASSENRDLGKLVLQLGSVSEEVSVTAGATPVQTASSERSALIDNDQLNNVALKGRDAFGYMRLVPGIVDSNTDRSLAGPGSAGNISINGMATNTKNVTFDGVTQLDQGGANAVYVSPNMDAIGEIKVLSSSFQAEFGRNGGGGINMVTKSGTQAFHGTAFWNRRHEGMNANTFFNNRQNIARPIYRYFVGGYGIGGPVYIPGKFNKDKRRLFFFVSQEWTQVAQPTVNSQATLPTVAERSGDFSNSVNSLGKVIAITDPATGAPFAGNKIPQNRIDPTGLAILNQFLKPNGYVNPATGQQYAYNFIASATPFYKRTDAIVRVDGQVTEHMNMYLRWGNDTRDQEAEFMVSPGVGPLTNFLPGYNWSGHIVNMISPTTVNEAIIGVGHNNFGYFRAGTEKDSTYFRTSSLNPPTLRPFPTGEQYEPYLPAATFAGGALPNPGAFIPGYTGNQSTNNNFPIPYKNFNDTYSFQDDLSKVLGPHSLKVGVYYEYNSKIEPAAGNLYAGLLNFGSNVNNPLDTGHGYANALLGIFQTYTEATNRLVPNPHFTQLEGYVQDNWRVSRRLTLDLGLRWYHVGLMADDSNAYSNFYPGLWDPKKAARIHRPATVNGKSVAIDPGTGNTTFAALVNTLVPGSGDPVNGMHINGMTGKGDFASFPFLLFTPRVGFAYDIFGDGKTAIRGSFGTFYSRPNANFVGGRGTAPTIYTPVVYYSPINQIPQAAASAAIAPTAAPTIWGDQKIERSHQFNLTVQRDIGFGTVVDLAYVGTFNRHAQTTMEMNPVPLGAYADPANIYNNTEINPNLLRTRYPGMGSITYSFDGLSSVNYHALQVQAQHRMSHGLQFGLAFAWSKAMGTCGAVAANGSGCTITDPYRKVRDFFYGPMPWDRKFVTSANFTYKLPGVRESSFAKHIVNNWTLSGIAVWQTGAPVTPECSSLSAGAANSDPSLTGYGAFTAANPAGARCQAIADPQNYTKDFYHNFNTSAFALAPVGTFGNIGIGILRQPSWGNLDLTLDKRIPLGKDTRRVIRARIEAYNIMNHTEFNAIGSQLQLQGTSNVNTTWGQYTATMPSRVLSTTIRFEF